MINLTQAQRDALIAHCKEDIESLKNAIRRCGNINCSSATRDFESQLLRQQITLAALEAEPKVYDITIEPWIEYAYPAPPVPVLKPVVLPDLRQSVSGDRYVWSDGVGNYHDDVIKAIRKAGYPIAGE